MRYTYTIYRWMEHLNKWKYVTRVNSRRELDIKLIGLKMEGHKTRVETKKALR